ncbi:signal recognition particle receptor subunit beta [Drosophila miranda]|uniref:Signal recognition particle receptor subunit beta n=1 Tax=Drosophila pseudoobscura pseudoobscura TaxID=46245 RepID=Q29D12_DROPS|nr:signal recognition particle receptor subunit beta [Drosophila pseudoobscura]XP_017136607.1 signal recognition particle receptor subunit beta [Drosophila miranda]XP_026848741.1 signal recognition particle receptor subunit beta [Drosophila persimilis]
MDKLNENVREKKHIKLGEIDSGPILVALLLGFIAVAIFVILRRRSAGRRDFLLTGLCESGKSAIFMQLLHGKLPETFTSIKENVGDYQAGGHSSVRLVDIPGHYRVRDKCFDLYKHKAKGIVFVVDSVTVQKDIRDVADTLYTILADSATQPCSVLVLCNKQDQTTAKSAQVIKSLLEKELHTVRDTRSRKLQSVGDDDVNKPVTLGKPGRDFEFAHISQNIQFVESSAKEKELNTLTDWMGRLM